MTSNERCELLDLLRDLPTTPEDVAAQRRLKSRQPLSSEKYLQFLRSFESPSYEELRSRRGARGDIPFSFPTTGPPLSLADSAENETPAAAV